MSAIGIEGIVTIKCFKKGSKLPYKTIVKNNTATKRFLTGMAKFIRGDFISDSASSADYVPRFLAVGTSSLSSGSDYDSISLGHEIGSRIDVATYKLAVEDTYTEMRYQFFIDGQVPAENTIRELGLFVTEPSSTEDMLARVILSTEIFKSVGETIDVTWAVRFQSETDAISEN